MRRLGRSIEPWEVLVNGYDGARYRDGLNEALAGPLSHAIKRKVWGAWSGFSDRLFHDPLDNLLAEASP